MAMNKKIKDSNINESKLGYVKAHHEFMFAKGTYEYIVIEFIQTKVENNANATLIKCNDEATRKEWENMTFGTPPDNNRFVILAEILKDNSFIIDELRPFRYPTHDKNGHRIIY